jgi:hypothetical protein
MNGILSPTPAPGSGRGELFQLVNSAHSFPKPCSIRAQVETRVEINTLRWSDPGYESANV